MHIPGLGLHSLPKGLRVAAPAAAQRSTYVQNFSGRTRGAYT